MIQSKVISQSSFMPKGKLLRILSWGFGLAITIGGTIGVSIFRLPGPIAALLAVPGLIILIWLLGGIYTLLSANYTAELATMLPKAGGPYVYAHRAYGPYIGFVVGWSGWLGDIAALSFLSIALGEYVVMLFPPNALGNPTVVALIILVLLAILNWVGLRSGSFIQKITSIIKSVALLVFIAVCFIYGGREASLIQTPAISAPSSMFALFSGIALSFQLVLGAYGGWNTAVYFSEEDKNPGKNIPRSLHYGVLLVIAIYLLVNFALLYVLPVSSMAGSQFAARDALRSIMGEGSARALTLIAVISILGIINAVLLFVPRILFALGRDGLFTSKVMLVNKGGTPVLALAISVITAIILIVMGSFETLMAVYTFYAVVNNILLVLALFILRKREPHLHRPFKTWAYPFAPFVLLLISIALCIAYVISDTLNSLYALATIALSYPLYLIIKKGGHRQKLTK